MEHPVLVATQLPQVGHVPEPSWVTRIWQWHSLTCCASLYDVAGIETSSTGECCNMKRRPCAVLSQSNDFFASPRGKLLVLAGTIDDDDSILPLVCFLRSSCCVARRLQYQPEYFSMRRKKVQVDMVLIGSVLSQMSPPAQPSHGHFEFDCCHELARTSPRHSFGSTLVSFYHTPIYPSTCGDAWMLSLKSHDLVISSFQTRVLSSLDVVEQMNANTIAPSNDNHNYIISCHERILRLGMKIT